MKKYIAGIFTFIIALTVFFCIQAQEKSSSLSQSFSWTNGDWAAYCLSQKCKKIIENQQAKYQNPSASASVFVRYDRKKHVIFVEIFGGRKQIEKGKNSISYWLTHIQKEYIEGMSKDYNILLSESDFILIYYNREQNKEIIRLENEQFLLPKE